MKFQIGDIVYNTLINRESPWQYCNVSSIKNESPLVRWEFQYGKYPDTKLEGTESENPTKLIVITDIFRE